MLQRHPVVLRVLQPMIARREILAARRAHKARVKRFREYMNMARAGVPVLHLASWMNFRIMVAR